jgi:hypothetical protein
MIVCAALPTSCIGVRGRADSSLGTGLGNTIQGRGTGAKQGMLRGPKLTCTHCKDAEGFC